MYGRTAKARRLCDVAGGVGSMILFAHARALTSFLALYITDNTYTLLWFLDVFFTEKFSPLKMRCPGGRASDGLRPRFTFWLIFFQSDMLP